MVSTLKLPVGIDSFEKIRRNNFYYIDKTKLIEQLVETGGEVTLFTRPRRFGKTLNMSMLKSFLRLTRMSHCLMAYIFQATKSFVTNIWESTRLFFCHSRVLKDVHLMMQDI